jgi:pimeloyl-ACP methyl ester carboxylesterase
MNDTTRTSNTVVLLHGLGRSTRSMRPIAKALQARGYQVLNLRYPSRTASTTALAHGIARQIDRLCPPGPLHFVTHSLGGVLLRIAVAVGDIPVERIARVVMLGPPNGGSELVDTLTTRPVFATVYGAVTGPAGLELGTGAGAVADRLPPVVFPLGVIAGNKSINPVFSSLIPRPNDGKVSVTRTAVPGMRDMLVLPYPHLFLVRAPAAIEYAIRFLEFGSFVEGRTWRYSGQFAVSSAGAAAAQ